MNTVARRCCPGCGAPAPLALGQDWCRYCAEYIGVSLDMAVAVQEAPSTPAVVVDVPAPKYLADSWDITGWEHADVATLPRPLFEVPTDWIGILGRWTVNVVCALVFAVPVMFALWAFAVAILGQS